jgi:hypothetical protein
VQGVESALGRLDGVQHVEAVLGTLRVHITPAKDRVLHFAAVPEALLSVATVMERMEILADGRVEDGRFRIEGWPEAYPIEGAGPSPGIQLVRAEVRIVDGAPRLRALPRG